ncbi:MAG: periplasmic binding protein/LacI transcriptional regulator [Lachnospiraceae bacterium]|nr:periplasmic binding protein/LacI transcriptional regulator [Lachnospiraceae bacterium]
MNKRKLIFDVVVILSAFIIFVTWHNDKYQVVPTTSISEYEVYLITMDKVQQFAINLNSGAKDMAEMLGVNYIWDAPEERDADEQVEVFNRAIEAGADVIMIAAVEPVKISRAIENAKAKGVKIVYVDSPALEEGTVTLATDNYSAGRLAGEVMIAELEAVGIKNGSIGIIGVTPVTTTTISRENGFRDVMNQNGNYTILDTVYSVGDPLVSRELTKNLISANSDLVGLFGTNEGATIGIGYAIQESNNSNIIGIGFDYTETIDEMLKNDILQAVLVQNPYTMGYLGMAEAVAAIKGYDTGPPFIDTGVSIYTKYLPRRPQVGFE